MIFISAASLEGKCWVISQHIVLVLHPINNTQYCTQGTINNRNFYLSFLLIPVHTGALFSVTLKITLKDIIWYPHEYRQELI